MSKERIFGAIFSVIWGLILYWFFVRLLPDYLPYGALQIAAVLFGYILFFAALKRAIYDCLIKGDV